MQNKNDNTFLALTALWAFVEAGFGGFLHALHLPFTGILLGGFAVLIISLLAQCYDKPFQKILQATLIVLSIKILVNPATSPFAYIAVAFQGFLGASIYSLNKTSFWSHFAFATLSMLESAAQKLLILTLFLGKTFWQGVNGLGDTVSKIFGSVMPYSASNLLIVFYLSIFLIWGFFLAIWMHKLPKQIADRKNNYLHIKPYDLDANATQKKKQNGFKFALLILILSLLTLFIRQEDGAIVGFIYIIRTLGILSVWQFILQPIFQKYFIKFSNKKARNNTNFFAVKNRIPNIARHVKPLYAEISKKYKGIKKLQEMLLGLIVISLQETDL